MPWLQHALDRRARHRAPTEGDAGPRAGAIHALQGMLRSPGLSLQAEPSGRAAHHQGHGERSGIDVVAGGAVTEMTSAEAVKREIERFLRSPEPEVLCITG